MVHAHSRSNHPGRRAYGYVFTISAAALSSTGTVTALSGQLCTCDQQMVYRENQVCPVRIGLDKNRARSRFLGLGIAVPEVTVRKKSSRILGPTHVDWRAVRVFLALAFGLAWAIEGAALALGVRFTSLTPRSTALLASVMFVPALAALVVRRFITHEGFATAGLRRGPWRPALIYGAIWGLWHAPIIAGGYNYPGYPVTGAVMMCALTIAFALTQTALRLRFDSVLLTSFFHASINNQGLGVLPMLVIGVSPILGGITGLVGVVVFGALGTWLLARTPEPLAQRLADNSMNSGETSAHEKQLLACPRKS